MAERAQGGGRIPSPAHRLLSVYAGAIAVLVIGAAFIVGGLQLSSIAGRFPVMLGGTAVILAILEIIGVTLFKASNQQEAARASTDREEIQAMAWVLLTIIAIYVTGILIGAFVSTFLFSRLIEKRGISLSAAIAVSNVFVIWFAFSYLAKFSLYRGAIF